MPQQALVSVENNFTKGLITEATALNFPENAATDVDNCAFTLVGDVARRKGIDFETNFILSGIDRTNTAINTYKWNNAGGDGNSQFVVAQVGAIVNFFGVSTSNINSPLSSQRLANPINLSSFLASGATFDATAECTFADGNGYLFIFHPSCDPIYCTYVPANGVTGHSILLSTRDFAGIDLGEGAANLRPAVLSAQHQYNLINQGWSGGSGWQGLYSDTWVIAAGSHAFTVQAGIVGIVPGVSVSVVSNVGTYGFFGAPIPPGTNVASGTVTSYAGTTLTVNVTAVGAYAGGTTTGGSITPLNTGYIGTFATAASLYPSNADVWWYFKDATDTFAPATTLNKVTLGQGNAPRGSFLMNPFIQARSAISAVAGLTNIITYKRPSNGAWHAGRIFYTGITDSFGAQGDAPNYTWTENIYFSQVVQTVNDLGKCYQVNDPTSETLFDLLPTDGGVITIQGCGTIYKLFSMQNGLLVFAANGVWFITGSQGIGFSANDYTVTKISGVRCLSSTSFVNVNGLPYFWNLEGIYSVEPKQGGGLSVNSTTYSTIDTFYSEIPISSKQYVRGDYNPVDYVIQWLYRDTETPSVDGRYSYNRILNYNVSNKAFFPYSLNIDNFNRPTVNGICYVQSFGGVNSVDSAFRYFSSFPDVFITQFTFSNEYNEDYRDWASSSLPFDFESYFITGYKLRGQGIKRFQPQYVQVYSRVNDAASAYTIQGIWDYANSGNSGRWSRTQLVTNGLTRFDTILRRHKIRGHGYALQFKIASVVGMPFDIQGWAVQDTVNAGT